MSKVYIKAGLISVALFAVSYILASLIYQPIKTQRYFDFNATYSLTVIGLMLASAYLTALSVGIWGDWKQFLFVALPPIAAITFVTAQINPFYGIATPSILFVLLCIDIVRSNGLKNTFIKFKPSYILSLSTNGLLFIFSVIGGVMVILSSPSLPVINVGQELAGVIEPQVKRMVRNEVQRQTQEQMALFDLENVDPALKEILSQAQDPNATQEYVNKMDFGSLIEEQINSFVAPYKDFMHPILAVLMFVLFQFYASITKLIFAYTIDPVFAIAKKVGFLRVEKVTVEKEDLKF